MRDVGSVEFDHFSRRSQSPCVACPPGHRENTLFSPATMFSSYIPPTWSVGACFPDGVVLVTSSSPGKGRHAWLRKFRLCRGEVGGVAVAATDEMTAVQTIRGLFDEAAIYILDETGPFRPRATGTGPGMRKGVVYYLSSTRAREAMTISRSACWPYDVSCSTRGKHSGAGHEIEV